MPALNQVTLIGNLTRDPEVRYTPKGTAVADISLAINRKFKTESGETQEEVTYVDVVVWAKLAEVVGQHCHKGQAICVVGRLQTESWDDKTTGQKRSKLRVVAENVQFLGERQEGTSVGQAGPRQQPAPQRGQTPPPKRDMRFTRGPDKAPASPFDGNEDDEIPFN